MTAKSEVTANWEAVEKAQPADPGTKKPGNQWTREARDQRTKGLGTQGPGNRGDQGTNVTRELRDRKLKEQGTQGPGDQETQNQRTRNQGTRDSRDREPKDHGTKGPGNQEKARHEVGRMRRDLRERGCRI